MVYQIDINPSCENLPLDGINRNLKQGYWKDLGFPLGQEGSCIRFSVSELVVITSEAGRHFEFHDGIR